jgi:hypothetical protein
MMVPASSQATMRTQLDLAGLGVDLDDREVGAEGEGGSGLGEVGDARRAGASAAAAAATSAQLTERAGVPATWKRRPR